MSFPKSLWSAFRFSLNFISIFAKPCLIVGICLVTVACVGRSKKSATDDSTEKKTGTETVSESVSVHFLGHQNKKF